MNEEYQVDPPPNPLVIAVRRYLVEVERCNAVEVFRLRAEMRKLTADTSGRTAVPGQRTKCGG